MCGRLRFRYFSMCSLRIFFSFFFFNDTATTEIYTLSLHDALPISVTLALQILHSISVPWGPARRPARQSNAPAAAEDRKSTRLNSSHLVISYAVFCLKKKKKTISIHIPLHSRTSQQQR